jgi:hypothetical protein
MFQPNCPAHYTLAYFTCEYINRPFEHRRAVLLGEVTLAQWLWHSFERTDNESLTSSVNQDSIRYITLRHNYHQKQPWKHPIHHEHIYNSFTQASLVYMK